MVVLRPLGHSKTLQTPSLLLSGLCNRRHALSFSALSFRIANTTTVYSSLTFWRNHYTQNLQWIERFQSLPLSPVSDRPHSTLPPRLVYLQGRAIVAVTGRDAPSFLQGLTTSNIPTVAPAVSNVENDHIPQAIYSAFLNAQGRLLQDAFIYPLSSTAILPYSNNDSQGGDSTSSGNDVGFLIEVDSTQADALVKSLRRFKLRAKVNIHLVDSRRAGIFFAWNDASETHITSQKGFISALHDCGGFIAQDDRAPHFGCRIIAPLQEQDLSMISNLSIRATPKDYVIRRYLHSVPEGQTELPNGVSLVQESGIDFMRGVDFRKGCYVGQELTIRTQHTGVVRKRILPIMLYKAGAAPPTKLSYEEGSDADMPAIPYGADIKRVQESGSTGRKSRSAGRWVANVGNVGLALVRLETMVGVGPTGEKLEMWSGGEFGVDVEGIDADHLRVKAFVPEWWKRERFVK